MSELSIPERVAAGAAWLDENRPGWLQWINVETLDIRRPCNCVLGQLYGDYFESPEEARNGDASRYLADSRGFNADEFEVDDLTSEWRRLIESRRSEAVTE